jgi:hypothetical protein
VLLWGLDLTPTSRPTGFFKVGQVELVAVSAAR